MPMFQKFKSANSAADERPTKNFLNNNPLVSLTTLSPQSRHLSEFGPW